MYYNLTRNNGRRRFHGNLFLFLGTLFLALHGAAGSVSAQQADIFQTYVIYNPNSEGSFFRAGGRNADNATTFNGLHLGAPTSLLLRGAEIKTYKNNGGDVTGARLHYRVYAQSATPGAFNELNLPFSSNLNQSGDQRWRETSQGINLLQGLAPGEYVFEVYWRITTNLGDRFDSNNAANYKAYFTVRAAQPSTAATTPAFSNTTATTANIGWTNGNGARRAVVMRQSSSQTALAFDGTDDQVTIPSDAALNLTNNFSIEAWIKPKTLLNTQRIFSRGTANTGYSFATSNNQLQFTVFNVSDYTSSAVNLVADRWTHVAVAYTNGNAFFYVNGVLAEIVGGNGSPVSSTASAIIGAQASGEFFTGQIDELRVWSAVRFQQQVSSTMFSELAGNESGLVAYYKLQEGTGTTTVNSATATGATLNGTLSGFNDGATTQASNFTRLSGWTYSSSPINAPLSGTSYTANSTFGSAGAKIGSSDYVIYEGTGNMASISGLTPSKNYFIGVYEYNGSGITANYQATNFGNINYYLPLSPVFVSSTGNNANTGYSADAAKATLQEAVNTVEAGGTIRMEATTYPESININKPLTLMATGSATITSVLFNGGTNNNLNINSELIITDVLSLQSGTVVTNGNLVLASAGTKAAMIDDFSTGYTGNIAGVIQAKRYLPTSGPAYYYLSSPVSGATLENTFSEALSMMAYYDESLVTGNASIDAGWVKAYGETPIQPFQGWSVYTAGTRFITFAGTPNSGFYDTTVKRSLPPASTPNGGFNVLGNPYPSPISWTLYWNLNGDPNIHKAVYVWNSALGRSGIYNFSSGLAANGGSDEIASTQAFRVRRNNLGTSTSIINNSVRIISGNNKFMRSEKAKAEEILRLSVRAEKDANGYETVIHTVADATPGIDADYDAEMLTEQGIAQVYSKTGDAAMTLNALPSLRGERTVALGVSVPGAGNYELSATEITAFAPGTRIYLEDRKLGLMQNLSEQPVYKVYLSASEANRFFVHFNPATKECGTEASFVNVYGAGDEVVVQLAEPASAEITVLNMLGQVVQVASSKDGQQVTRLKIDTTEGAYLVRVATANGTVAKKVMLSGK